MSRKGQRTFVLNGEQISPYRLIYEIVHGVKLKPTDVIHHKDGNNKNDHYSNLVKTTRANHLKKHPEITKKKIIAKTKFYFDKEDIFNLYKSHTMLEIAKIKGTSISPIQDFIRKNKIKELYRCENCGKKINRAKRLKTSRLMCDNCNKSAYYYENKHLSLG